MGTEFPTSPSPNTSKPTGDGNADATNRHYKTGGTAPPPPIPFPCGGGDLSEGVADRCTLINASSWVQLIRPQIQRRTLSVSFIAACLPPILSLDAVCRPSL